MQFKLRSLRFIGICSNTVNPKFNYPVICSRKKLQGCRLFSGGGKGNEEERMYLVQAGLPLFLFCGLGVWVVSNGIAGKNRERDAFQGRISKSERQAVMEKEHDDMMHKLNRMMKEDFDNTKRIERPDEVLSRRRKERENRNVWYRRLWRNLTNGE